MNILYLPAYSRPEGVASSYLGSHRNEAFEQAGFTLYTYAPVPTRGITDEVRKVYKKEKKNEVLDGGRFIIHRFNMFREGKNPILRALRYTLSAIKQFNRGVFAEDAKKCDVMFIHSTPPIQGAMAALVKKCRKNLGFVYNLQDIFPDSLVGTGLAKKNGLLWKIGRSIENFTYRNADKIIVISEDFKRNIMAKGVPEEKIVLVYNWVDASCVVPVEKEVNPLFEEFGISRDKFTVVYAGNLGYAQNLSVILDAAPKLNSIQFVIFGTGGLENEIRSRIDAEDLTNVKLLPLQPPSRVSQVYSLGDVCLVSCKAGLGGSAMPSKTWSIMSCARPVLAHFDGGELKEILENNDCGVFTQAGNVDAFVQSVKNLSADSAWCREMGKNARQFILENLTKEVGTRKLIDVIKSFEK